MQFAKDKLEWLEFDLLGNHSQLAAGVFERHGGASKDVYASLNASAAVGDHPDAVKKNRERICDALGAELLIFPHQSHGVGIVRITGDNCTKEQHADALFTTEKNLALAVTHADCQAAIFYDPVHKAVGIAHAGWRGSVQNIYAKLIDAMKQTLGTKPHDLIVCISPSLGPDHAEFKNYKQELPESFWSFQVKPHYFDFWAISKSQLAACGVPAKNVEIAGICTYCTPEDYFSYRREHRSGRNTTAVCLK